MTEKKVITSAEKEFGEKMSYYWFGATNSAHKKIQRLTDKYKSNFLKKMFTLDPREINPISKKAKYKSLPEDLIVCVKRDGGYYLYYYDENTEPLSIFCNSPNGRAIYNLPVSREMDKRIQEINTFLLNDIQSVLKNYTGKDFFEKYNKISTIALAGELFANIKKEGDRPRAFDLIKLIRSPEKMEDLEAVNYDLFDIVSINGIDILDTPYEKRLDLLEILFPRSMVDRKAKTIEHRKQVAPGDVIKLYGRWVETEKQEGIIIHTKFNMMYKVKSVFEIDAVIIGYVEMLEEQTLQGERAISSMLLALMRPDGTFQELCRMGGGLTYEQRVDLYKLLKDDVVESAFKASKGDGRAYLFIKPKYIVQIKYMDVVTEDALGESIRRTALKFENNQWTPIGNVPFVSVISPRYDVMRSVIDKEIYRSLEHVNPKEVKYEDLKVDQITDLIPIDAPESVEVLENLPKSKILFKVVFKGKWGGVLSAYKVILWATNKSAFNRAYPNFIVYNASYSYTRAQPLEQEIHPFNTLEKAIAHLNWIFVRPDNPGDGFIDKTGTKLKGSIVAEPYKIEIDENYKTKIVKSLTPLVRDLLFEQKALESILGEILDFDSNKKEATAEKQKAEKLKTPKKKLTTTKKVPEKNKEEKLLEEILDLDSNKKEETAEEQKVELSKTPTTGKKKPEKDKEKKAGKKDILDEILDMNLDDIDFDKK